MSNKHMELIEKMEKERKTICEFCGREKEGLSFMIGASLKPAWVMVEGTGKMACPDCSSAAMVEGNAVLDKHIDLINESVQTGVKEKEIVLNSFEIKRIEKAELCRERAEKADAKSEHFYKTARNMAQSIPLGQPILIGHHSENSDRNYRKRMQSNFEKGHSESEKADYWKNKAAVIESNKTIFSDDPDALNKLNAKLKILEQQRQRMKSVNRAWQSFERKGNKKALYDLGFSDENINAMQEKISKAYRWEKLPFVRYQLSNLGQNIQNIKKRIGDLENRKASASGPAFSYSNNNCRVLDNIEDNRTQIFFPFKPSETIRHDLKKSGFRWSPTSQAWQRHISNYAHDLAIKIIDGFIQDKI